MLYFLNHIKDTVMAFFIIFSLAPSRLYDAFFGLISLIFIISCFQPYQDRYWNCQKDSSYSYYFFSFTLIYWILIAFFQHSFQVLPSDSSYPILFFIIRLLLFVIFCKFLKFNPLYHVNFEFILCYFTMHCWKFKAGFMVDI